jgi:hypothetical protein
MHSHHIKLLLLLYAVLNLIGGTVFHFATLCSDPEPPTTREVTVYFVVCTLFGMPLLLGAAAWHIFKSIFREINDTQVGWFSQERLKLSESELHSQWDPKNSSSK